MTVPYTFGSATAPIPLSQLDSNFASAITLGNTAIQLGNTVTTLNNMTLANVTVSSGNVTATNVTATNVTSPLSTALTLQSNAGNTALTIDTSQNVGIGTSSPSAKLDVVGTARVANTTGNKYLLVGQSTPSANDGSSLEFQNSNGQKNWAIRSNWNVSGALEFCPSSSAGGTSYTTPSAVIDSSGNLLVGTTSNPAGVKLVIGGTSGTARVEPVTDNVGYIGEGSYRWQAIYAVNGTIQTSDGREKNTIEDSNLGLSFVQSLRPVSYKWNVGENIVTYDEEGKEVVTPRAGIRTHYGFIAQEVQAAIPDGVDFGGFVQEPNEGMMSLRYHEFIGPLVKAIQEQQALIQTLQTQVAQLQEKVGV